MNRSNGNAVKRATTDSELEMVSKRQIAFESNARDNAAIGP